MNAERVISKSPSPDADHSSLLSQAHDFFALSIATSPVESKSSRNALLNALEVVNVFRQAFKVRFNQLIVCSDASALDLQDPDVCMRGASLHDIQTALQDVLRCMLTSRQGGKQLSLLLHLHMELSPQDDTSADDASAGSSDGLVPRPLHCTARRISPVTTMTLSCGAGAARCTTSARWRLERRIPLRMAEFPAALLLRRHRAGR
jgi:hypothetical protein